MPSLLIVIPLLGVLILNLPLKNFMDRLAPWFVGAFVLFQIGLVLCAPAEFWSAPLPLVTSLLMLNMAVDNLSLVMFLSIAIVAFAALLVGRDFISENKRFNFANLLMLSVIGMNGVVLVQDLFSLYVFLEITAVTSFILIALDGGRDAFEGAFKYIVLSAVATVMILLSLALVVMFSGSLAFGDVAAALSSASANPLVLLAAAVFLGGLCIKGGIVPFHGWVPDAYSSAPAPVSVLLAGIVTKTTGIYTLMRVVTVIFGSGDAIKLILLVAGVLSIVVGALAALGQHDFKRMLAYSSISQVGYIILGLGVGTDLGMAGAVFHLFNHSIFKSLLFVNSAAVERQTGTRNMDRLGGIASKMPVTGVTSVIALLSTAGIPPLAGFWSKLIIIVAAWQAGYRAFAVIAVLASVLTLAYFLLMQRRVFFGKLAEGFADLKEAGLWIVVPTLILMLITIGIGLAFPWMFGTFLMPVRSIL